MAGPYDSAAATARRLLAAKGRSVTLTRAGQGAVDEEAGTRGAAADLTATFNCVGLPPGKSAEKEVGSLVGRKLQEFYMARTSGALDPDAGDSLPWGGHTWKLIWVANYDPDARGVVFTKAYGER